MTSPPFVPLSTSVERGKIGGEVDKTVNVHRLSQGMDERTVNHEL